MRIRAFQASDEVAVVSLWEDCGLVRPWNEPRRDIARKLAVQPELFLVALDGDTIVGTVMAGYEGHRGWINYLATAPARRGKGIARALMAEAERMLLELGCPKVNLQVRSGNDDALGFYAAIGYSVDAVTSLGRRLIDD